jgi:UDP-glucuronate 4-epimerase
MASTYSYLYNLPCTGFRFFTVYGPRCRPDMAPFKFIHRIANGIPIQRYGDGSTERDYTFVSDIVAGIMAALDKPSGFRVFNLGNGHPVLLSTFISTIERVLDKQAIIEELPPQPGDVPRTSASIDLARKELNFQPSVNIDEGLKLTADWYLQKIVNEGIEI